MPELPATVLQALRELDTPTICNALELICPERRGTGFTTRPLVGVPAGLPSFVGYARTATIRAMQPCRTNEAARQTLVDYYRSIENGPRPSIAVIQDLDGDQRGFGSFWGEVNSNIHMGLGCVGVVTDGSVRDVPQLAPGFSVLADRIGPSHAFVHVVDFGRPVNVSGMLTHHGDLIHADQHGAVIIPHQHAAQIPAAAAKVAAREAVIIAAAQVPGFDVARLQEAWQAASGAG